MLALRFSFGVFVHLSVRGGGGGGGGGGGENENLFITPFVRSFPSFVLGSDIPRAAAAAAAAAAASDVANDSLDAVAVGQGEGGGLSVVARGVGIAPRPLNDVILARR